MKDLYEKYIVEAKINTDDDEEKNTYYNNLISVMRDFISFNEWMAVIIRFMDKFKDEEALYNDMFTSELRYSKSLFYNSLNDVDFYTKGRMIIPKYVLIRMDMEKSNPELNKLKYTNKIIVEHMLPRRPSNLYWKDRFSTSDRGVWANKLANLILINGAKNSQASAKPFKEKIELYVCKKGDFNINKDLSTNEDWNIEVISKRQENMINEAMKLWM